MTNAAGTRGSYDVLRPTRVREVNATAILRLLFANGPKSRAEIASDLRLTQGPITRITAQLAGLGLISELAPTGSKGRGRPRIPIAVVSDAYQILGVHIGVEHIAVALTDLSGMPVSRAQVNYNGTVDEALQAIMNLAREHGAYATAPILGLGVIMGGWIDSHAGVVRRHDFLNWVDVPLQRLLQDLTDLPVFVESSIRAHAVADLVHGAATGFTDFMHVFVGNVIEVAVVMDGRVRSASDGYGGAISGWPIDDATGRSSTARAVLSDQAVIGNARAQGLIGHEEGLDELLELARRVGNEADIAERILIERARDAGRLIAQLNAALAPELIVVSSGVLYLDGTLAALQQGLDSSPLTIPRRHKPVIRSGNTPHSNSATIAAATVVLDRTLLDSRDLTWLRPG